MYFSIKHDKPKTQANNICYFKTLNCNILNSLQQLQTHHSNYKKDLKL